MQIKIIICILFPNGICNNLFIIVITTQGCVTSNFAIVNSVVLVSANISYFIPEGGYKKSLLNSKGT